MVEVPRSALDDLARRLEATRLPAGMTDSGGFSATDLEKLLRHWRERFDWNRQQQVINQFHQFRATVDGLRIHFIHERSGDADATPLLLLHGWPGSFIEMLPLVPRLLSSCHVVVPSLPGFGFSDIPRVDGVSNRRMARMLCDLMAALGYERFAVHGGDVGAGIATWMARDHARRVSAIHLNYIPGSYAPFVADDLRPEEKTFLEQTRAWSDEDGAYQHLQRTRPLTLAYGLSDSPAGLAAWIAEKFGEWSDPSSSISVEDLLTNITIYWLTNTIASSVRLYLESTRTPLAFAAGERIDVPCAVAHFPFEISAPPRSWVERAYDVRRWTEMPRGGHFAALEAPDLLAADIASFTRRLQQT